MTTDRRRWISLPGPNPVCWGGGHFGRESQMQPWVRSALLLTNWSKLWSCAGGYPAEGGKKMRVVDVSELEGWAQGRALLTSGAWNDARDMDTCSFGGPVTSAAHNLGSAAAASCYHIQ